MCAVPSHPIPWDVLYRIIVGIHPISMDNPENSYAEELAVTKCIFQVKQHDNSRIKIESI